MWTETRLCKDTMRGYHMQPEKEHTTRSQIWQHLDLDPMFKTMLKINFHSLIHFGVCYVVMESWANYIALPDLCMTVNHGYSAVVPAIRQAVTSFPPGQLLWWLQHQISTQLIWSALYWSELVIRTSENPKSTLPPSAVFQLSRHSHK